MKKGRILSRRKPGSGEGKATQEGNKAKKKGLPPHPPNNFGEMRVNLTDRIFRNLKTLRNLHIIREDPLSAVD